ncbi:F0F1 ATP synthase subunit gamma [Candidatus Carsonella ruddii]|uniref:F-ATPase gamma subunit n=1 Tax=Carsonella ruddii TaxID=114186 RepID=A0AAJ6FDS9_CARRU|nr:F0F1 ATP synthase subunit gamma [Candidatus Carsonella ruddii]WGS66676.1 F0F1 ATP synthase subunit gamma [Candidatus Carsonella ruddii]WGS66872.1 F0F1 ATP synthase subunit gamma [Candidatus Carsonella ruddii]WGS67064.1 F0F1 ATP synthase subunit gamma [Candidatus Carsonella ruddii]WGS67257.1 F0F1 ATP synthase subunit gamma [Candidatus Carsonella ruddii]WMC18273.1 MAG: F0F1 ATP synthase subunit gamma [Candidatus Carsonella ruddii]
MNIRDIKCKINILLNVNKLTNTMSMISFSKMNKFHKQCLILSNLYLESKKIISEIYDFKKNNLFCCILITTNKGYCGNMNNELIKYLLKFMKNNKNLDIIIIGKKAIDFFSKKNIYIKKKIIFNEKDEILFSNEILSFLKLYKNIFFISAKLINNSSKIIKTDLFIKKKKNFFEKNIDKNIINNYLNYTLNYLYSESYFCELKLRMITMKSAADNSLKIIKSMNTLKNKIRQYKVTQDMLEIINGSL